MEAKEYRWVWCLSDERKVYMNDNGKLAIFTEDELSWFLPRAKKALKKSGFNKDLSIYSSDVSVFSKNDRVNIKDFILEETNKEIQKEFVR